MADMQDEINQIIEKIKMIGGKKLDLSIIPADNTAWSVT